MFLQAISTLVVIHYFFAINNDNMVYGQSFKMEAKKAALTKCDNHGNHANQLITTTMKGIKQIDSMTVVIVTSHSNECG